MTPMRISVTTLESFRLWETGDWMPEEDLQNTIKGLFVPTPPVLIGQAFGKVLETPWLFEDGAHYRCDGYAMPREDMRPALALMDHERGVFEVKATGVYGGHVVATMADQLVGSDLFEHKTTLGTFAIEKYWDSYQWRFMVDIFGALKATYHVFLLEEEAGMIRVRGIETIPLYPYVGLHADCEDLVHRFVEYVYLRGLNGVLEERQRASC